MSTIILNGYKFSGSSIQELNRVIDTVRETLNEEALRRMKDYLLKQAIEIVDRAALSKEGLLAFGQHEMDRSPLSLVHRDARSRLKDIQKTGYRDPDIDMEVEISLFFDTEGGAVYVMSFAEHPAFHRLIASCGALEEFRYWDHTDPPDGSDEEEWAARRDVWDRILGHSSPAREGYCRRLVDSADILDRAWEMDPGDIRPDIMDLRPRAVGLARSIIVATDVKAHAERICARNGPTDIATEEIIEILGNVDKDPDRIERQAGFLEPLLPASISLEDLMRRPVSEYLEGAAPPQPSM